MMWSCWPPSIPKRPGSCLYYEHRWTAAAGATCWSGRTCCPRRGSFPGCDSGRCRCYQPRRTWEESAGPRKPECHARCCSRRRCCCVRQTQLQRRHCCGTANSVHQTLWGKKNQAGFDSNIPRKVQFWHRHQQLLPSQTTNRCQAISFVRMVCSFIRLVCFVSAWQVSQVVHKAETVLLLLMAVPATIRKGYVLVALPLCPSQAPDSKGWYPPVGSNQNQGRCAAPCVVSIRNQDSGRCE